MNGAVVDSDVSEKKKDVDISWNKWYIRAGTEENRLIQSWIVCLL